MYQDPLHQSLFLQWQHQISDLSSHSERHHLRDTQELKIKQINYKTECFEHTFQSSDGSFINTSMVHMSKSELFRKALSACIMIPSIKPFSLKGIIRFRICRVIRKGISSGNGKN